MLGLGLCLVYARTTNGILEKLYNDNIINVAASGSTHQYINGSKQLTKPEYSIFPWNKSYDWCSNFFKEDNKPWISINLKNRKIKLNGYFIRVGCCYKRQCCCLENDYCVDCCLYSWALQISNDNHTWTDVHKVEKDSSMRTCAEKQYKLDKEYEARYVRVIQTDPCPGEFSCIALNRFDILGETINDDNAEENFVSYHDDDEDISIIGHISRNEKISV